MEFAAVIVETILDHTVAPIGLQLGYLLCYKRNIDELNKKVKRLQEARDRVQHLVDAERRKGKEIEGSITNWLLRVDEKTTQATEFQEDGDHANAECSTWSCPNLLSRYKLSRRAKKMVQAIIELQEEEGKIRDVPISYETFPRWIEAAPSTTDYRVFESRTSILKEIIESLKDPNVFMIGVYGLGGVGKTTLVKEVARKAKEDNLFDVVVMAVVTQYQELDKIQGDVAEMLGLKFEEQSEFVRAGRLWERLKQEKRILVILDDLWARLDLHRIGIPFGEDHKGCKILLTSRNVEILSNQMDTQKNFLVGMLPEEEAWNIFKAMAEINDLNDNSDLLAIAEKVAKACAGLPIAIVTVSRALRKKSVSVWRDALHQLRKPTRRNIANLQQVVDSTIKLSYDHLENQELKDIFLLCASMAYYIDTTDLLKYCVGLGLFKDIFAIGEARDRLDTLIHTLKASCLLFDHPNGSLIMHDVVRDVALSIASKHQHLLNLRDDNLNKWPGNDQLDLFTAINLFSCNIGELPEGLECPQLTFLTIGLEEPSLRMPNGFFKGMTKLRVLDLTTMHLSPLPSSITLLTDLQTLCLDYCILEDIAAIAELKNLKILSLQSSDIKKLPHEMAGLTQIQLLDLSCCSKLAVIPSNVISNMKKLEELRMERSFVQWKDEGINSKNASLEELNQLPHLTILDIHVPNTSILQRDLFSQRMERYKILIGDVWNWAGKYETSRTLKLSLNRSIYMEEGLKVLLKRVEDLYLDKVGGVKCLNQLDADGFSYLKNLHVQNNVEIQYIFDSIQWIHTRASFPKLESLVLHNLVNLEKIYSGQFSVPPFCNLKVIKVNSCHKLKNLFSFHIVKYLTRILEVEISNCNSMEEIVTFPNQENPVFEFLQLKSLTLQNLPALIGFFSDENTYAVKQGDLATHAPNNFQADMSLFCDKATLPRLEVLKLSSISFKNIWHQQLAPTLTSLIVGDCRNVEHLFSYSVAKVLVKLEYLEISKCKKLEVILKEEGPEKRQCEVIFPNLETMVISDMDNLITIWNDQLAPRSFGKLKKVEIQNCKKLTSIFRSHILINLENFETLSITNCSSLNEIFKLDLTQVHDSVDMQLKNLSLFGLPKLKHIWSKDPQGLFKFQNLQVVQVDSCELSNIFPASIAEDLLQLKELCIRECRVEAIVAMGKERKSFLLPQLTCFKLIHLKELKCFYPGMHTLECPMMKELEVVDCNEVKLFGI
ncbi:hypothetical protein L6164_026365 [Bauhinia variegata]|uniref:Uncharacterized protein n=1 Tax=Bauhinia variegata TaxID=167791 RepID=A0ACB9LQ59_BAUVA|nr:hypothetical protein L6164_026365 [Bauhinia variegata]